jgi:hypothetical protein
MMDSINLHGVTRVEVSEQKDAGNECKYRIVKFYKKNVPGEATRGFEISIFGDDIPFVVEGKITEAVQ